MKLIALTPIEHDGKPYAEGDALDVADERQAQALIDLGAAEAPQVARKPRAEKKAAEPDAEAQAAAAKALADTEALALAEAEAAAIAAAAAGTAQE